MVKVILCDLPGMIGHQRYLKYMPHLIYKNLVKLIFIMFLHRYIGILGVY